MQISINTILKKLLLTVFTLSISACGGGSDNGNTEPVIPDTTPPTVVSTNPSSDQTGIKLDSSIEVIFSEAIANINADNVSLNEFSLNALIPPTPITYQIKGNTLIIQPEINSLRAATKYRVFVRGIKDIAGNVMEGRCEWMFGTIGSNKFGLGNTGVCATDPVLPKEPVLPKDPIKIPPIVGEGTDVTPPTVVLTKPSSEQTGLNRNSPIEINFNEVIANVISDNIRIFEYAPTAVVAQNIFTYQVKAKTLTLYPELNSLRDAARYYVVIRGIQDTAGNAMLGECVWTFGTIGRAEFGVGKTGVCTTDPIDPALPNVPANVLVFAGDGSVKVSWQAPKAGDSVSYYKLERRIDNPQKFEVLNNNISATTLSYTDNSVLNDTRYYYRITAGNSVGLSAAVLSNAIIPKAGKTLPIR